MKVCRVWSRALAVVAVMLAGVFSAHAQSPAFRVDPYWPKPLPNNWIIGQVGGMAIDAQDNIWVFQRPRSLTDDEKGAALNPPRSKCCVPAPSVLVFDQAGNVVKSWGGPGDNLGYDWPLQEHGILVDNKGFVWLSGNGETDNMILKFTTDGKFVKELGRKGPLTSSTDLTQFGRVADLKLDPKANEVYVADGYGNHRVAVLDADTGEIKRIWGAYGKPPTDDKLPPYTPDSPQFANPVHCIGLAKDGLVYVCDRANNRVQVFQKDGTFVRQYVFDAKTKGAGSAWNRCLLAARQAAEIFRPARRHQQLDGIGARGRWCGGRDVRRVGPQRRTIPLGACRRFRFARKFLHRRGRYRETPAEMGAGGVAG